MLKQQGRAGGLAGRTRLTCAVSAAALLGVFACVDLAQAQTLTAANSPLSVAGSGAITVTSGTTALFASGYYGGPPPNGELEIQAPQGTYNYSSTPTDPDGTVTPSKVISVQSGATLIIGGQQTMGFAQTAVFNDLIQDSGNFVVEGEGETTPDTPGAPYGSKVTLDNANTILGNITLEPGAYMNVGDSYATATLTTGPNTNISLTGTAAAPTSLVIYEAGTLTVGGALSASTHADVLLGTGALVVNGQNTAANPFVGTLTLSPGTTFTVGDSSHPTAVFGDPGNTDGSTETINVVRSGGSPATLTGYGVIYATVNNAGVVTPGGTAGTLGTLTVSQYTQTSTGILNLEVSPTGASQLHVLGTANLAGSLNLKIDPGSYGNAVIPIISAGAINGGFTSVTTSGGSGAAAGLAVTPTSYDVVIEQTSSLQVFGHLVSADQRNVNLFADTLFDALQTHYPQGELVPKAHYDNGFAAWIMPYGGGSNLNHDGYGYSTTFEGVTGAIEHGWNNLARVGVAASYGAEDLDTDGHATKSNSTTYDVAVYGGFNLQNARVDAIGFYNSYDARVDRNLGAAGSISSAPSGTGYGASLQLSNGYLNNLIVPYLRGTYIHIDQDAVTESGTNLLALSVDQIQKGYVYGEAGFKVHPDISAFLPGIRPEVTVAVLHNFTYNQGEQTTAQFANLAGSPFSFDWRGEQGTSALVGLNLAGDLTSRLEVFGKIAGDFSAYGQAGEARLGVKYRF